MSLSKNKNFAKRFLSKIRRNDEVSERAFSTARKMRNLMQKMGFNLLGRGTFGAVFDVGQKSVVLKVMSVKDNLAYISYARHCQRTHTSNPLLPKVYGMSFVGEFVFMVIEKLVDFKTDAQAEKAAKSIRELFAPLDKTAPTYEQEYAPTSRKLERASSVLNVKRKKVGEACAHVSILLSREILIKDNSYTFLDVSCSNVMRRYNPRSNSYTAVLTDPLAN